MNLVKRLRELDNKGYRPITGTIGDEAATEIEQLSNESAFAHRLAVMLECSLLDPTGTWNEAHALLEEYRSACATQDAPTFMGEPLMPPNV